MDDQANGVYTYDIESVTVPGDRYWTWMADYNTTAYIAKHELRWENRPCVTGCAYRYGVQSTLGSTTDSVPNTETDLIRFKVCPSSI